MAIRIGGYQGEGSVHTQAMHVLAAQLGESGIETEFTPDITRTGRMATDLFTMVEGDELDICYFASSYLVHRVPNLGAFDLPFAASHRDALFRSLDGELGRALVADIERLTGFVVLGFWDNGFRHLTNARHDIVHPADCESQRIRTMDSEIHAATFAAMGFEPVYIDVKDYPAAVREGVVSAQENPLTNIVNFSVQDSHKHLTLTGHFCGVTLVLGNAARLDGDREALLAATAVATAAQRRFAAQAEQRCFDIIEEAGVSIRREGEFDRAAFVDATKAVRSKAETAIDRNILSLLERSV